jgi:hypothetical protein
LTKDENVSPKADMIAASKNNITIIAEHFMILAIAFIIIDCAVHGLIGDRNRAVFKLANKGQS